MKQILLMIIAVLFCQQIAAQNIYYGHWGSRLFPGHWDVFVTVSEDSIRYEAYNHAYTDWHIEKRKISIPVSDIDRYGTQNDTLQINIEEKRIHIKDGDLDLKLQSKVKAKGSLCRIRKLAYADKVARENGIKDFWDLYSYENFELTEEEFYAKVDDNLRLLLLSQ